VAGVRGAVLGRRRIDTHPADWIGHHARRRDIVAVRTGNVSRGLGSCHSAFAPSGKFRAIKKRSRRKPQFI
jgi:hypothetical protein